MIISSDLYDGKIRLRCLRTEDITQRYLDWLLDAEVHKYLEIRHSLPSNVVEISQYVQSVNKSDESILFGIYEDKEHIGNIKLGPIDKYNRRAEVGLLIGEKGKWGRGYATRAIRLVSDYAFQTLRLVRLTATCCEPNLGSFKAFIKGGYKHEGTLSNYWQSDGQSIGEILMGLTSAYNDATYKINNFGNIDSLVLIGGGNLLLRVVHIALSKNFLVGAILSNRQAAERVLGGDTLLVELQKLAISVYVAKNSCDIDPLRLGDGFSEALALCFGPAWVFPDEVLKKFPIGMLNFHPIVMPHYLGGAHFTWQILNGYRRAGCHLQRVDKDLDRGDLIFSESFELPKEAVDCEDYFRENDNFALCFMEKFLNKVICLDDFHVRSFSDLNNQRLYFPRLITTENGWIDWSWSGSQIAAFCSAFGPPYRGASTRLNGRRIYLKRAKLIVESSHPDFHPFCSGLIVRRLEDSFFIAVSGGLLKVDAYEFENEGNENVARIREGDRMFTDAVTLDRAIVFRPQISVDGNLISKS